jgi:thioredoxin 1
MKHLLLSLILVVLFSCTNHSQQNQGIHLLPPVEFAEALKMQAGSTIVDVRTPEEFQGGHLKDAVNINIYDADFDARIGKLDKKAPVYVYCKAGGRSADAAARLQSMGFASVYDLKGGFMAWSAAGMESTQANHIAEEKFTPADFDALIHSETPVMIDYYAPWCGPCKKMEPILKQLSVEYAGKVQIIRINVDEAATVVKTKKIENIPVVSTFKNGSEIRRVSGFQDETSMRLLLEEITR